MNKNVLEEKYKKFISEEKSNSRKGDIIQRLLNHNHYKILNLFLSKTKIDLDYEKLGLYSIVQSLTTGEYSFENIKTKLDNLKNSNVIKDYKAIQEGGLFELTAPFGLSLSFMFLSNKFPQLLQKYPELISSERLHKCHFYSFTFANTVNMPCRVVTGKYFYASPNLGLLHSVVVLQINENEEFVLDMTMNAIFPKEEYFKVFQLEPISEISNETIKKDYDLLKSQNSEYLRKNALFYLLLRNDIMEEMKNQKVSEKK